MSENIKPDYAYFIRKLKLVIEGLELQNYTAEELACDLVRLAKTSNEGAAFAEFPSALEAARQEGREIAEGSYQEAHRLVEAENAALKKELQNCKDFSVQVGVEMFTQGFLLAAKLKGKGNLSPAELMEKCKEATECAVSAALKDSP